MIEYHKKNRSMGDPNTEFSDTDFHISMVCLFKKTEENMKNFTKEVGYILKSTWKCCTLRIKELKLRIQYVNLTVD